MWSRMFQGNVERFAVDAASSAPNDCDDTEPICLTNASVESHFTSVKHRRLHGCRRIRPYQFVATELEFDSGELNELKLPKLTKQRKDISQKEERWRPWKRQATYSEAARAATLMKTLTRSKNSLPHRLLRKELADTEIQLIHDRLTVAQWKDAENNNWIDTDAMEPIDVYVTRSEGESQSDNEYSLPRHQHCACHTLNLITTM